MSVDDDAADPVAGRVEEIVGDMFDLPAVEFFARHPEAEDLARRVAVLEQEADQLPSWTSPAFEEALDELRQYQGPQLEPWMIGSRAAVAATQTPQSAPRTERPPQHRAPSDDGYSAQLHDALRRFGSDVFHDPYLPYPADAEALDQLRAATADPGALVRVYSAVPPDRLTISAGDWVTLSRLYAQDNAYQEIGPAWPVVYADVPAAQVWTNGEDPSGYGYTGPGFANLTPYAEGDEMPPHPLEVSSTRPASDESVSESVDFRPSAGALAERRLPPTVGSVDPDRGIGTPDR